MTKKHFIALAAEIKSKFRLDVPRPWEQVPTETQRAALAAVEIVCNTAHQCNPRFDETRFRIACGVPA